MTDARQIRWISEWIVTWQRTKRPDKEKLEYFLRGFVHDIGSVTWDEPGQFFSITFPGRSCRLSYRDGWMPDPTYMTRWFEVALHGEDSISVRYATSTDPIVRALATTALNLLGGMMQFDDHWAQNSEAATS